RREFLYVDDMANACIYIMNYDRDLPDLLNIGTGEDISIGELALLIKKIMGYEGEIVFDTKYPDGTMRKLLDVSKLHSLGWKHQTGLEQGLRNTVDFYLNNHL